jgi:hypothetical protein
MAFTVSNNEFKIIRQMRRYYINLYLLPSRDTHVLTHEPTLQTFTLIRKAVYCMKCRQHMDGYDLQ